MAATRIPAAPVLSRGRHHWPSRRVCLMEYAAAIAGEPKTDKPSCTDPALAAVARAVNDYSSDGARQRLAALAPVLARARRHDERGYAVARRCVLTALPYADGTRRFVMTAAAYGVDHADAGGLSIDSEWALLDDADTLAAVAALSDGSRIGRREHAQRGMPRAIEAAVDVIARNAPDGDEVLYRLLVQCIADHFGTPQLPVAEQMAGAPA